MHVATHMLLKVGMALVAVTTAAVAEELSVTIAEGNRLQYVDFQEGVPHIEKSGDAEVLRLDQPFDFRINLKPRGIEPRQFDLIKMKVKADGGAFMRVAVENHPRVGDISYWYVLDGMRGPFDWKTLWVDLTLPEEVKSAGDHRSPSREGLSEGSQDLRGIRIQGRVNDLKSKQQGPGRNIWVESVRLVKQAVQLDWDQTKAPYTWGEGQDLVFTYPLKLTNKLTRPVTARVRFEPVDVTHATATVKNNFVPLQAGETTIVEARVALPAQAAANQQPLYCERFLVTAETEDIPDSQVTILRSSDPIHLTVTVPLDEQNLQLPFFPRPSELPDSVTRFDADIARQHAARDPQPLVATALRHGLYQYGSDQDPHNVAQYRQTLISAAYLYDMTGEPQYLATAKQLLTALPAIWDKWDADDKQQPVHIISSGIVARWQERSHYTLGMGWLVMGTQRSPYYYGTSGNGRGGSMGALAYAFDIIAPQLNHTERQGIIDGFFVPAGIQARNHYIGDGNQQMTADLTAIYAGLLARNWPLVSFGYSSEHGLLGVLENSFDDDGVQLRKNYQTYTLRPILWASELLYGAGLDIYKTHQTRLTQIINADTRAKNQGAPFEDLGFWQFIDNARYP